MKINRLNYELHALDYIEGTLPEAERIAMQAFLKDNPELEAELLAMAALPALSPDFSETYEHKDRLLKHEAKVVFTRVFLYRAASVAAAALLLISGYVLGYRNAAQQTPESPIAQIVQINPNVQVPPAPVQIEKEQPAAMPYKQEQRPELVAYTSETAATPERTPTPVQIPAQHTNSMDVEPRPAIRPLPQLTSNLAQPRLNSEAAQPMENLASNIPLEKPGTKPGRQIVRFARNLFDQLPLDDIEFSPIPTYYTKARQTSSK